MFASTASKVYLPEKIKTLKIVPSAKFSNVVRDVQQNSPTFEQRAGLLSTPQISGFLAATVRLMLRITRQLRACRELTQVMEGGCQS